MLSSLPVSRRYHFLDINVDALTRLDLDAILANAIDREQRLLIGNHNLHSLYLFHQSEAMRAFYALADCIHVDGISIVQLAKLFGVPLSARHRTGYMDWLPSMMSAAQRRGWRVFYLGSRPGVLEEGLTRLRRQWPGLQIEGRHGYFDKAVRSLDNLDALAEIAQYQPDLLMVGMGMPVQEEWIVENLDHLPVSAVVACGALMDYVAGVVPTPPRWLGPAGLEWAFRLAAEPRRLWRRYLVEPWTVLQLVGKHLHTREPAVALKEA
jgi:N-acetylglucosaminyldiphosphoundecaprenol N-acetyl-beta-D-mannosaminyltransferase